MHLQRMREFNFFDKILSYIDQYGHLYLFSDQDAINTLFHFYPGINISLLISSINIIIIIFICLLDRVYVFDCTWNFYIGFCNQTGECPSAVKVRKNKHKYNNKFII